jgi:hypothetical protein
VLLVAGVAVPRCCARPLSHCPLHLEWRRAHASSRLSRCLACRGSVRVAASGDRVLCPPLACRAAMALRHFDFTNLCGTVYKCGNVAFTPDGNCLLSPVGNRITMFDLVE